MTIWKLCTMGKCIETGVSKRWITGQILMDVIIYLIDRARSITLREGRVSDSPSTPDLTYSTYRRYTFPNNRAYVNYYYRCPYRNQQDLLQHVFGIPVLYLFLAGVPNHRGFFCDDPSLSYPYKTDTISTNMIVVIGFSISIAVVLIVELLNSVNRKCYDISSPADSISYIIKCYIVFLVGFNINQLFVEIIKNETGALRPNFLDVCRPQYNSSLCPGYIMEYECTGEKTTDVIRRSRQSFPSGHSAFTMYIAVYFCFYIHHRLKIRFSRLLKVTLQVTMIMASAVCGFRRILDHKHHFIDVISGFFLGAFIATFVYKTLAERIMTSHRQKTSLNRDDDHSDTCCSCATNGIDPVNSIPLLSKEYKGIEKGYSCKLSFKDNHLKLLKSSSSSNPALSSIDV